MPTGRALAIRKSRTPGARPAHPARLCTHRLRDRRSRTEERRSAWASSPNSPLADRRPPRAVPCPTLPATVPPPTSAARPPTRSAPAPGADRSTAVDSAGRIRVSVNVRRERRGRSPTNGHPVRPWCEPQIPGPFRIGRCSRHRPTATVARTSARGSAVRHPPAAYPAPACRVLRSARPSLRLPSPRAGSDSTPRRGSPAMRPRSRSGFSSRPEEPRDLRPPCRLRFRRRSRPPSSLQRQNSPAARRPHR